MTKRSAGPARTTEKERYYRELLRRQSRSGASIREVAEQEGIPSGRLRSWKSRIARLDRRRAETGRPIPLRAAKASAGTKPKESAARTESLSLPLLPVRVVGGREGAGVIEPGFAADTSCVSRARSRLTAWGAWSRCWRRRAEPAPVCAGLPGTGRDRHEEGVRRARSRCPERDRRVAHHRPSLRLLQPRAKSPQSPLVGRVRLDRAREEAGEGDLQVACSTR